MGEEDGGCDSNNAKTLNNTASTVANFRDQEVSTQPVSDAKGPYTGECLGTTTMVLLDGTGSSVPDPCQSLTFSWSSDCVGAIFDDSTSSTPTLTIDTLTSDVCTDALNCNVTLTVTNSSGETDEDTTQLTIEDTTPPVVSCPNDITIECDESAEPLDIGEATASDNCDVLPVISYSDVEVPGSCPEEKTVNRTWTATDACSNSSSCVQTISVVDTTPPIISPPADVTIECDESADPSNTGEATASDNCDTSPAISYSDVETPGSCPEEKTISRTWTATDACGNTSSYTQIIDVVDTTAPIIDCNAPVVITPPDAPISFIATAIDNCDDYPLVEILEYDCYFYTKKGKRISKTKSCIVEIGGDTITILDSGGVGDYIGWTVLATDNCGNESEFECEMEVIKQGKP
jgi:hypothetical protein